MKWEPWKDLLAAFGGGVLIGQVIDLAIYIAKTF